MSLRIVPKIEALPLTVERLFNHGFRGGCNDHENKDIELKKFEEALNDELTKAFQKGIEYIKVNQE